MTHTPGPWKILRLDLGDEEICSVPVAIRGGNGRLVVDNEGGLAPEAYEWTVEEIEANAHLIAAAPDLLAVLEELRESSTCCGTYDLLDETTWASPDLVDRIESAITKARGEE